jgi:hypothetical protein
MVPITSAPTHCLISNQKKMELSPWVTSFAPPDLSPPVEVMEMSQAEARAWQEGFSRPTKAKQFNAAYQASRAAGRYYETGLLADGTFRVDDVAAGTYRLIIYWQSMASNGRSIEIAQATTEFVVPEAPGGGYSNIPVTVEGLVPTNTKLLEVGDLLPDTALVALDG